MVQDGPYSRAIRRMYVRNHHRGLRRRRDVERGGADDMSAAETRICLAGCSRRVTRAVRRPATRTRARQTLVLTADAGRGEVQSQPQYQGECDSTNDARMPTMGHGPVSIAHRAYLLPAVRALDRRHGFLTALTAMRISTARSPLSGDAPYLTRTLSY